MNLGCEDDTVTERLNERRGTILGEVLELSRVIGDVEERELMLSSDGREE